MFKKDGEVKVFKPIKEVSPKVADKKPERYTVDDLVKEHNDLKKDSLTGEDRNVVEAIKEA